MPEEVLEHYFAGARLHVNMTKSEVILTQSSSRIFLILYAIDLQGNLALYWSQPHSAWANCHSPFSVLSYQGQAGIHSMVGSSTGLVRLYQNE